MRSEDITHAVNELIKSGNANKDIPINTLVNFHVDDIYPVLRHCFSPAAIKTLDNKTYSMVHQYNVFKGVKGMDHFHKVQGLMRRLGVYKNYPDLDLGWRRHADLVHFVGSTCTYATLQEAVNKVVAAVNDLSDKGYTKASLMPLGLIKFAECGEPTPRMAILSYITLTEDGANYAQKVMPRMMCKEGSIPEKVENQ